MDELRIAQIIQSPVQAVPGPGQGLDKPWRGLGQRPSDTVVVIPELPEEPSTLIVRLMGRRKTLKRALEELRALPKESFEHRTFQPILLKYHMDVAKTDASPEDKEFVMETEDIYKAWEREKLAEGRLEGRLEGRREGRLEGERQRVLKLLRRRFGELPAHVTSLVENADEDTLDRFCDRLMNNAKSAEDVVA